MVKNMPAIWETQVRSLDWEDPLEEGMATHSSILAWRIPWTEEPGGLQSMGSHRVRHDWATNTFTLPVLYLLYQPDSPDLIHKPHHMKESVTEPLSPGMGTSGISWALSVQFSHSVVSDSLQPHGLQHTTPPCLSKLMSIESVMPSNHLLCCPFLLPPSIFPSIRVFSNESVLHIRWSKYWSFSFSISPSNEYSGLISFRIDWLDLLAIQGTLKSLLQHPSLKASILWCSAFFMVQLSHPYMTTGKTIALTRRIFVGKVMSLLFNILSRLVITFLPRSKYLLISWLHLPSAVILEPKSHTLAK